MKRTTTRASRDDNERHVRVAMLFGFVFAAGREFIVVS
jgi:hypothetical protein